MDNEVKIKLSLVTGAQNQQTVSQAKSAIDQVHHHNVKEAMKARAEIERINSATTRSMDREENVRAQAAKRAFDEKQRLIKREQTEFLRAEAEKTAAARAAATAQIQASERLKQ